MTKLLLLYATCIALLCSWPRAVSGQQLRKQKGSHLVFQGVQPAALERGAGAGAGAVVSADDDSERPMIDPLRLPEPCLMYAFGIAGNSKFEQRMSGQCRVFAFDCTVRADSPAVSKKNFTFSPLCIGAHSYALEKTEYGGKTDAALYDFRNLTTIIKQLGHSHINILKMDIEGSEWNVLYALLHSYETAEIRLPEFLFFELHTEKASERYVPAKAVSNKGRKEVNKLFQRLKRVGYRVVSKSINPSDPACADFVLMHTLDIIQ
jgi:hypothetical protein